VVVCQNAVVVPPSQPGFQVDCGVIVDGADCAHAANWRGKLRMTRQITTMPQADLIESGRHMWGGLYYGHFGHFMTETISRCWALGQHNVESMIFVPKHQILRDHFTNYQAEFWSLLDTDVKVKVIRTPTLVEELVVPGQAFGLGKISAGTPEFRALLGRIAEKIPADEPRRIYISRTRFGGRGGVLCESIIEHNMREQGYTIVYPEKMKLIDQMQIYKSATHIVGVDSSAFHIAGMMANPSQKFAFILRRTNGGHRDIATQIEAMIDRPPEQINVIQANWIENLAVGPNHLSWGELDHAALARQLHELGFIESARRWLQPTLDESMASAAQASEVAGIKLVRTEFLPQVLI
jgi:capsular polysaccharide biosynthesis protein